LRVIAGSLKGRRLEAVPGSATRPTTDKIKEAVFQIMGPFFEGGSCLDLFAGSGSLGIEALSRGMERAVFVDKSQKAVQVIRQNLAALTVEDQAEVFRADAYRAIHAAAKRGLAFDLLLLDPPYRKLDYGKLISEMDELGLIREGGIIYCEHDPADSMPEENEALQLLKRTDYSRTIGITIYRHT